MGTALQLARWLRGYGCGSSLVAERQEWSWLARSSPGPPSHAVAGAAAPPVSHGGSWKMFLFYVACLVALFALGKLENWTLLLCLRIFQLVMAYGCCLWSTAYWIFRKYPACTSLGSTVDTCSSRGLERIVHISHVAVNSNPEAFGLHSFRMEKRAQSMLLVAVSLSAVRTLEVDISSTSAPFSTVCGNFRCVVQHFSGPSVMKNSSSSRAHAN